MAKMYPGKPNEDAGEPSDTPRFELSPDGPDKSDKSAHRTIGSWVKEILIIVAVALVLSFLLKTFLFRAFFIPSGSMENTLAIDDRIFVNQLVPEPFALQRGDVVVFRDTQGWLPEPAPGTGPGSNWVKDALIFIGLLPDESQQHLVKRVIGLEGDRVICCDADGRMTVNGEPLDEPYLFPGASPSDMPFDVTVPEGKIWVMGDHRNASADSRANQDKPSEGFIDVDDIEGKAAVIAWPLNRIGFLGNYPDVFDSVPDAPQAADDSEPVLP
ncbi:signal peptidase I [Arthrobacter sp. H5]|uniref:signal peptidase I n=1 Tax=Arthrobacter sp. H5 TaxID=1267973 RepID=UPI00048633D8|nr:signal peptidase I [Arthrobacter sp. H5]